jgi:hypothetical protein
LERIEERKMAKRDIEEIKSQDEFLFGVGATPNGVTKGQEMIRKSSIIDDGNETPNPDQNSPNVNEEVHLNTMQKLFFGRIINILKVKNDKRFKIFNKKIEKMGPIMLDVNNYGGLYDAWNSQGLEDIEDFNCKEVAQSFFTEQLPNGASPDKPKCIKETWIQDLPRILLFSIN